MAAAKTDGTASKDPSGAEPIAPPWYKPELGSRLTPLMREILQNYSGIPPESVEQHVSEVRERAWKQLPRYPCVGQWQFLQSLTPSLPGYKTMVERVRNGASVLDLGCCFAQDLRIIAAEGAPTQNMVASDLVGEFWDFGFDLFRDREKMLGRFFRADIFDSESELTQVRGKIDIVIAAQLFHLFSWDMQVRAIKMVIELLTPNGWIMGYQVGASPANEMSNGQTVGSSSANAKFYHDEESFKKIWRQVEDETKTKWIVEAVNLCPLADWRLPKEDFQWMGADKRGLSFLVTRQS